MQSIFGALLTAGYAAAAGAAVAASSSDVSSSVEAQLTKSFAGAEDIAEQYPQDASTITAAAKESFLQGDQWAYLAGIVAILAGAVIVAVFFPKRDAERALLAAYQEEDRSPAPRRAAPGEPAPAAG
jgi:MFS transporter, DHA2 family, multidrug resistance protein